MKKPGFYCTNFIENHSNIKKYQPPDCKQQCTTCMDIIIDHHFNKTKNKPMETTVKQAVDTLTAALRNDPELFIAWQANIAMPFFDGLTENGRNLLLDAGLDPHKIANEAAIFFLNLLCEVNEKSTN